MCFIDSLDGLQGYVPSPYRSVRRVQHEHNGRLRVSMSMVPFSLRFLQATSDSWTRTTLSPMSHYTPPTKQNERRRSRVFFNNKGPGKTEARLRERFPAQPAIQQNNPFWNNETPSNAKY